MALAIIALWVHTLSTELRTREMSADQARRFRGRRTVMVADEQTWWIDPVGRRFDALFLALSFGIPALLLLLSSFFSGPLSFIAALLAAAQVVGQPVFYFGVCLGRVRVRARIVAE